jgi:putative two-component system response regulator
MNAADRPAPSTTDAATEIALRLRLACEAHEPAIGPHLDRVALYSRRIAELLSLPVEQVRLIQLAAPLHDLGKIGLPTELLRKPGALSAAERLLIQSHTEIGHRILHGSDYPLLRCAARIALGHHEWWNGRGYPHGRAGEAIPLEARIIAIADVYDALHSERAYKPAWMPAEVVTEMQHLRGAKFEPALLDLFLEHVATVPLPAG